MDAVTLMIKTFFDKNDIDYELVENNEDGIDAFETWLNLRNEKLYIHVSVIKDKYMYVIKGVAYENKVPLSFINGGLRAINEANQRLPQGCLYINTDDGSIRYFSSTHTDNLVFSEEAFSGAFYVTLNVLDNEVAQIIKNAITYEQQQSKPKKKGFFSSLFR